MDIFSAAILGVVEGITEFLPVSSTGHLILTGKFMGLPDSDFLKSFNIVIQLGAILAVVVLYWRTILSNKHTWKKVTVAFLPTAVIGLLLYKFIKHFLLGNGAVVAWALLIGGVILIVFELFHKKKEAPGDISAVSYKQAFFIGVFQSLAVIPGVSRSGATILGGLGLGLSRTVAAEFSFLLAVPTMSAAVAKDLSDSALTFTSADFISLGMGFLVSFVVAILVIKGLMKFLQQNNFIIFGVYRIIFGLLLLLTHAV